MARRHVLQRHRVAGRRHVRGVGDLGDLGDGAEDDVELAGQPVELGVVEGEPRQSREVRDLLAGDLRHGPSLVTRHHRVPGADPPSLRPRNTEPS
mgnify:CR=1 FL=1